MASLVARPRRWYSSDYRILDGDREIASLRLKIFRDTGVFEVEGKEYQIRVEGFLRGRFELMEGPTVLAKAEKSRRTFEIRTSGHRMTLKANGLLGRSWDLHVLTGPVGSIRSLGWLKNSAEADLPDELPLSLRVFLFYLVLVTWRRQAAGAAAAGG
jgi:hypothetical protein